MQESMIVGTKGRLMIEDHGARITDMQAGLRAEILIRTGVADSAGYLVVQANRLRTHQSFA